MTANDDLVRQMTEAAESSPAETEDAQRSRALGDAIDRVAVTADTRNSPVMGKGRSVKRFIRRMVNAAVPEQAEFNIGASDALHAARGRLDRFDLRIAALEANSTETWSEVHNLNSRAFDRAPLQAAIASHDVLLEELAAALDGLHDRLNSISHEIASCRTETDAFSARSDSTQAKLASLDNAAAAAADSLGVLRSDIGLTRAHLDIVLAASRSGDPAEPEATTRRVGDHRRSELYSRFENRFRGTREQISAGLQVYDDDIARLAEKGPILDIGSGRGEWLDHLQSKGLEAYGVDTNTSFVDECVGRGLDVRLEDALEHLSTIPEGSLGAVTGFHLVEHLPIDVLVELVDRCMIALAPGGRILFETPNPTNLRVGAAGFYLDPTHVRPLHPDLLQFLATDRGFVDAEIRFVRPARPPSANDDATAREIEWSLFGPQDYAILATRPGAAARA